VIAGCTVAKPQKLSSDDRLLLHSPDGKIQVAVTAKGWLSYAVSVDGQPIIRESKLGLQLSHGEKLGQDVELLQAERHAVDSVWENPWGKRRHVRDRHNELRLVLREQSGAGRKFEVVFRAFDDGVAFR
jgi:alpha-glucosidase